MRAQRHCTRRRLFGSIFMTLLAACTAPPAVPPPDPIDYAAPLPAGQDAIELVRDPAQYPSFEAGFADKESLLRAVDESLAFMKKPSSRSHFPIVGITHSQAQRSLELFKEDLLRAAGPQDFSARIKSHFDVYRSVGCDGRGTVLFTGYCEPIIRASLTQTSRFRVPLYRLPEDLVKRPDGTVDGRKTAAGTLLPYYSRREIDEGGVLAGRGLELAWVETPLDAYFVHVQGSASLLLPDGSILKVGYAGSNGREYASIGQALIRDGKLDADSVSMTKIRAYFRSHPGELSGYLFQNERYIFFTENEGGPYGSIGAAVTAYRTIATDKSIFPRGAVTFIDTYLPTGADEMRIRLEPYRGFALDQDTGGAIRSAGRVDVFLGTGPEAEQLAGTTRAEGRLYYLFAK